MTMIKAIETQYKGYRFRSRLEARWAVFFDALGVALEYEPEGFELPSGERYLPDFRIKLPGAPAMFVEVKPEAPLSERDRRRVREFALRVSAMLVVRGDPVNDDAFLFGLFAGERKAGPVSPLWLVSSLSDGATTETEIVAAATRARQARFEHGECFA
jgi:hypothetical protein